MSSNRRHRAGHAVGARLRRWGRALVTGITRFPQAPGPSLIALAAGMACAAAIGGAVSRTTAVFLAAVVATVGAGATAAVLIRLALRIHGRVHTFGPCRGAGYLGLGTAIAATTAAVGGLLAVRHALAPAVLSSASTSRIRRQMRLPGVALRTQPVAV